VYTGMGPVLLSLAIIGCIVTLSAVRHNREASAVYLSLLALASAVLVFHCIFPQPFEGRYMIPVIAVLATFIPLGAMSIARIALSSPRIPRLFVPLAAAVILLAGVAGRFTILKQHPFGFRQAFASMDRPPGARFAILSDAVGEGAFVAEVASSDGRSRPDWLVLRASKLLVDSDWNSRKYELRGYTGREALNRIEALGIQYLVVDQTALDHGMLPHYRLLADVVRSAPDRLQLVYSAASLPDRTDAIDVYRVLHASEHPERIQYDLRYTLHRTLTE
jgi:hypothetical protein